MLSFQVQFVQTDRRTTVKQCAPPPIFQYQGIKNIAYFYNQIKYEVLGKEVLKGSNY